MFSHEVIDDMFDNGINCAFSCEKGSKRNHGFRFSLCFFFVFVVIFFFLSFFLLFFRFNSHQARGSGKE